MKSPYFTNEQAAAYLQVTREQLREMRKRGDLVEGVHFRHLAGPRVGPGRRTLRWFPEALADWMKAGDPDAASTVVPLKQSSIGGRR